MAGLRASGLGNVGPAATLAAALRRSEIPQPAGFHLGGEICRNPGDQRYLAVGDRAEDDRRRLEPVFEPVHGLAQGLRIGALEPGSQHFGALHVDRLRGKVLALARRQLRLESRQLPLERALFLALGPELVLQRRALGLEKILDETLTCSICCTQASAPSP